MPSRQPPTVREYLRAAKQVANVLTQARFVIRNQASRDPTIYFISSQDNPAATRAFSQFSQQKTIVESYDGPLTTEIRSVADRISKLISKSYRSGYTQEDLLSFSGLFQDIEDLETAV